MGLPLPKLDDRTYDDLIAEARGLIAIHAPEWTDHNASDPGVTLLELFAWLAEMLVYRSDQVPERHIVAFLRLLRGPEWEWPPPVDADGRRRDLADELSASVRRLRETYRVVTPEDFVEVVKETPSRVARVRRAHCVPRRHLRAGLSLDRPGHVSVLVTPDRTLTDDELATFHAEVWNHLQPRRLLGTHVHVFAPFRAPVDVQVLVGPRPDVRADQAEMAVRDAVTRHLDPEGWPFGRSVYASELYRLVEQLPIIDHVAALRLRSPSTGVFGTVPAAPLWHESGELVGLELGPYQLPELVGEAEVIAGRFVLVAVDLEIRAALGTSASLLRRAVKEAVARFFHPHEGGPTGEQSWTRQVATLRHHIQDVNGVDDVIGMDVVTRPERMVMDSRHDLWIAIRDRELVEPQTTIQVSN
jgi:hypothetical protein